MCTRQLSYGTLNGPYSNRPISSSSIKELIWLELIATSDLIRFRPLQRFHAHLKPNLPPPPSTHFIPHLVLNQLIYNTHIRRRTWKSIHLGPLIEWLDGHLDLLSSRSWTAWQRKPLDEPSLSLYIAALLVVQSRSGDDELTAGES